MKSAKQCKQKGRACGQKDNLVGVSHTLFLSLSSASSVASSENYALRFTGERDQVENCSHSMYTQAGKKEIDSLQVSAR